MKVQMKTIRMNEYNLQSLEFHLQVDVAILEVGIGGAYDCTNVILYVNHVIWSFKYFIIFFG